MKKKENLKVALAQISPVWFQKNETLQKVEKAIIEAANNQTELIVFGEGLVPGYPFWLAYNNGAAWDDPINKALQAHYIKNSITIEKGDLEGICTLSKKHKIAIYLGIIESPIDRGHSLYASLVYINQKGVIKSVHRKLQPTYDERLTWAPGDGKGLKVHSLKPFRVGGLNCWENWMPLSRSALYAQGEDLHIAVWPGSVHNTQDITRFIARESRSYVISVSSVMTLKDFPASTPFLNQITKNMPPVLANGGSCIAGPDGNWVLDPIPNKEGLFYQTLDFNKVLEERQNFDVAGHYSRPDVTQLVVNTKRQTLGKFKK